MYSFAQSDIVLFVPPFASISQPNLACHLLQSCARKKGFDVAVVYGNVIFASMVGRQTYKQLTEERLVLEFIFRAHAFDQTPELRRTTKIPSVVERATEFAQLWLAHMANIVRMIAPKIVGCTCSYEQISSSVALLNKCKEIYPEILTIIGGANCEGEMASGILSLGGQIDFVASGESESSFPHFLEEVLINNRQPPPIIQGVPCLNLDSLPMPAYQEFYEQYRYYLPDDVRLSEGRMNIPYESSRGCWWGEKHHCTFCGLNGLTMNFREKSPEVTLAELKFLCKTYPIDRINVVDNIMPFKYFKTLLPQLGSELPENVDIFYEQKANISLAKAMLLKEAHITTIQPGIESLNSNILRLMDKGVMGYQNLALLRYAGSLGINVTWNLLIGFPGDQREDYEEMTMLIPLIGHLTPADGPGFLRIDRFSPYFTNPEKYGIQNVRPKPIYDEIFPHHTKLNKLAYHFDGDYQCGALEYPEVIEDIAEKMEIWRQYWRSGPKPILKVIHLFGDQFTLFDTRKLPGTEEIQILDRYQASVVLTGAGLEERNDVAWAVGQKLLFEMDGRFVPLATAPPNLLMDFERHSGVKAGRIIESDSANGTDISSQLATIPISLTEK